MPMPHLLHPSSPTTKSQVMLVRVLPMQLLCPESYLTMAGISDEAQKSCWKQIM